VIRTGIGYDAHKLIKGGPLIVGGVSIPSSYKSLGHSDGDALIHAIIDAILGAASLGDIGKYFPSSNKKWEGVSSSYFLKSVVKELYNIGYQIENIDSTIILQKPMISKYIPKIVNHLSEIMQLNQDQVSVKATTTDGLGFIGNSDGWSSLAIASLSKT